MFHDLSGLIAPNPPARYGGVAVADVTGDGRPAFVVAGAGGPNRVLRWAGGRLVDAVPPPLADPLTRAVAVAAADLDGDGAEELYVTSADGPDRLFKRHPDGTWVDLLARAGRWGGGRAVAALGRRGIGRYGFAVAGPGPLRLVELTPDGRPLDLAPSLGLDAAGGWGLLAAPLFDPTPDLLMATEASQALFRNRGDGTFAAADPLVPVEDDEGGRCVAAVNVGGTLGLCLAGGDGPTRLLVPGPGGWRDRATPALAFGSAARAVVAADLDNDGHDELFLANHGEPNRLFRVTGIAGSVPEVLMLDPGAAAEPDGPGAGASVCDIDGDGALELLVTQDGRPLALYKAATAAGNGWLRIAPRTRFGAPARGAVVRLAAGGRERVKPIDGGPGEPVAHFGLGKEPHVERVTVTWPDGLELTLPDPDRDCTYLVPYPGG